MLKIVTTTDISSKAAIAKYAYRPEVMAMQQKPVSRPPAGFSLEQAAALIMARPLNSMPLPKEI